MSVFQPVDVRAPNDRRKQLVSKLIQQQAAQAPAQHALAAVSTHALGQHVGGAPRGVQHTNVLAAVLSRLGVGGAGDADRGFGPYISGDNPYSTGHYVAPNDVGQGQGQTIATNGGAIDAQPTPPAPRPTADGGFTTGYTGQTGDGTYWSDNQNTPVGVPTQNIPGLVPLGGGRFYDPVTDAIHGGSGGR